MKLDSLIPAPLRKPAKPGQGNGAKGPAPADLKSSPPERPSDAAKLARWNHRVNRAGVDQKRRIVTVL